MENGYSEVSMSSKWYTDEFKVEAARQVNDRGFKVAEVAEHSRKTHPSSRPPEARPRDRTAK